MTIEEFKSECLRLNSHYSEIFGRDVYNVKDFNVFYSQIDVSGTLLFTFTSFIDHILSTKTSPPDVSSLGISFDSYSSEERKKEHDRRRTSQETSSKTVFAKVGGCCGNTGRVIAEKEGASYAFRCDCSLGDSFRQYPVWNNQSGFKRCEQ
ncbi:MAG TPA: hypothetical protein PLQ20_02060 [Candidatus Paceibacterota bacterium]|nr:hypothetical protein [Candidatus Paceibacterota bacterium]